MSRSYAGRRIFICTTPQNTALANAAAFDALTYVEVEGVGNIGEFGRTPNMLSYNTLKTGEQRSFKGVVVLGSPTVEVARDVSDAGQDALRAAALTQHNYAIRIEENDTPATGASPKPTRHYIRAVVGGPISPGGGVDDIDLERFMLGINQLITAEASAT